jgi:hypothetical protein
MPVHPTVPACTPWPQRLLMCATKGFRGAALDYMRVDINNTGSGLGITPTDQRVYTSWLSAVARNMGLLVGIMDSSRVESSTSAAWFDFFITWELQRWSLPHFGNLAGV